MVVILSISVLQKQYFYFNLAGKKIWELWSIILGLASNFTLDNKAFNLGMYWFYYYLSFLSLDFDFLSSYKSGLFFFIKYFAPLN